MIFSVSEAIGSLLEKMFGDPRIPQTTLIVAAFAIISLVVRDYAVYRTHAWQHQIPFLWEFHKVHHAPESMVPMTSNRIHPVEQAMSSIAESLFLGPIVGVYAWLCHISTTEAINLSASLYFIVLMLEFSPLRHSHIDLRLGWLEKFIQSPAHHLLHHSSEREHWNTNYAPTFKFWDKFHGTYAEPPETVNYRMGLPNNGSKDYATLVKCYVTPFVKLKKKYWPRKRLTGPYNVLSYARIKRSNNAKANNHRSG